MKADWLLQGGLVMLLYIYIAYSTNMLHEQQHMIYNTALPFTAVRGDQRALGMIKAVVGCLSYLEPHNHSSYITIIYLTVLPPCNNDDDQGLSKDFKNACSKQQSQFFCLSKLSY